MINRVVRVLLVIVVFVSLGLWVGFSSKKAAGRFEPTTARLKRGRYIVEGVAHCFECHSDVDWDTPGGQPKPGRKGSGTEFAKYGFPWLVAPNITPDLETGAGTWTDEQLVRAIREGIGHDGRRLFPVMPYMYFRQMSDEDLASVIVYRSRLIERDFLRLPFDTMAGSRMVDQQTSHQPCEDRAPRPVFRPL